MTSTGRPFSIPEAPSTRNPKGRRFFMLAALGAVIAPLVATSGARLSPAATSNLQCATARSVLDSSDISYLGAIRMPASGVDTQFAYGGISGRTVNGHVRLFLYGNNVGNPSDAVYEIEDPGAGYSTNYTQAPRATLVTAWGDIYHGRRQSWDANGAPIAMQYVYPYSLHWNDSTQLLYWTYYDAYNVTRRPDWALGATSLDNPTTGATTAYGPWRTMARDGDGATYYGAWRCLYLFNNPLDGSMGCGAPLMSGNAGSPWGPDAFGGHPWPTAATPAGFGTPDLNLPNRYLEYYFMGGTTSANYVDRNGVVHGQLRSFRRTSELPVWEDVGPTIGTSLRANPALNGGVGSWSELDVTGGAIWLELTNKHGVIFATTLVGSPIQNPGDCSAAHEWYSNPGLQLNGACNHGCAPPVAITGPVTTASFPALTIYDPDQLISVRNGTTTDYTVDPRSVIDLDQTYQVKTAPSTIVGAAKTIRGFYFDPVRKYLYVVAPQADDSRPGLNEALIHVFAIRD
jgi:hypothetical protein